MMLGHALVLVRLIDERPLTLSFVFLIPGGDLYYYVANFWKYFPYFCIKHVGSAVTAGAAVGMLWPR